ncbi:Trypsin-like serine protease [Halocaridina rubra]|uniref:Trypsin-like serine protease n=1 Tax=Halocaridina rubra TaxID=373956 RepID=A0AAN9A187_HALRR
MRFVGFILTLLVLSNVDGQRRVQQGGVLVTDPRLGLLSTELGLPPVPGGQGSSNLIAPPRQPSGCFCLPINQACPGQSTAPNTSGAGNFDTRIVNRPHGGSCPDPQEKQCCFPGGTGGVNPGGVSRPNPVVPRPVQLGTCGVQNPIPYRPTNFAEAQLGEFPWMVVLLDLGNRYLGGGALIAPDWVLTAAHKVHQTQNIKVRLGEHDVRNPSDHPQFPHVEVQIDRVIVHPGFSPDTLNNDVALLHLSQPVATQTLPHIGTACLPEQGQIFHGQACWVTGWGKDAFEQGGSFQNLMKKVDVPIVDPFTCESRLRNTRLGPSFILDKNSFLCAGGIFGKDACTGDGGAPLVCPTNRGWTVVGLVAWGIGCATSEVPGVYVNIPNYVSFIRQYVSHVVDWPMAPTAR